MVVTSQDSKDVEVTHCDAGYAPGSKPTAIQNLTAVWVKVNDVWYRSKYCNAIVTAHHICRTQYNSIPDLISSQEETNGKDPSSKTSS